MSRHNDTGNDTSDEGGANQSDISNNQDDRQQYLDWAGTWYDGLRCCTK